MERIHASRTIMVLLIASLAACAPKPQTILIVPVSPPATITDSVQPAATSTPLEPNPTATTAQNSLLSADGPWLLINTTQGLWMANTDGSGGTLLTDGQIIIPGSFSDAVSPVGGHFAYLTTTDFTKAYGNYPNLKLHVLDLKSRTPVATLPLTSPETEPGAEFPSDITRAMVEQKSFA